MTHTDDRARPAKPLTLAVDIGGSHLKAAVLKDSGKISTGPLRVETPKPATPDAVVSALVSLSQRLGQFDRVSIGLRGGFCFDGAQSRDQRVAWFQAWRGHRKEFG
jgi:predicted NBD/HSP70 family sugar kinase